MLQQTNFVDDMKEEGRQEVKEELISRPHIIESLVVKSFYPKHSCWSKGCSHHSKDSISRIIAATVGAASGSNGNKSVVVNGLRYGKSNITVTLSNGKSTSYTLKVYDIGNINDIEMELINRKLKAGDTVTANDINISVPVISPDGALEYITLHPQMADVVLTSGSNELPSKLLLGGRTYDLTMTINL